MPIEFKCEACDTLLRVPDETAGRTCKCPTCSKLMNIPSGSASSPAGKDVSGEEFEEPKKPSPNSPSQPLASPGETTKPAQTASESSISIACPSCGHQLKTTSELLGTKGQCKQCQAIFTITESPQAVESEDSLVFECPSCNQLFEGSEEMRGRSGKCHVCGEVFAIELKKKPAAQIVLDAPAAKGQKSKKPAGQPQGNSHQEAAGISIEMTCPSCDGKMQVPRAAAGQTTACPYCRQLLSIPDQHDLEQTENEEEIELEIIEEVPSATPLTPTTPSNAAQSPYSEPQRPVESNNDPFGGLNFDDSQLPTAPQINPYAAPVRPASQVRAANALPSGRTPIVYVLPGIFVFAMGVLICLSCVVRIAGLAIALATVDLQQADPAYLTGYIFGLIIGGIFGAVHVMGGLAMFRQTNLSLCRTAAILNCLTCLCLPTGIWACVVLFMDQARIDFDE